MVLPSPCVQRDRGLPAEQRPGPGDVGLALGRIVLRQRPAHELRGRAGHRQHLLGQLQDGELARVAEVDRPGHVVGRGHHPQKPRDQVVGIAEAAGLAAVAVDGDRLALQRLDDEVRHHPAIVGMHARPVRVEDPHHLDPQVVLAKVVEAERLGAALALVVAGARPDRIDVAPVVLGLGMLAGVAVDLRGRGLEQPGPHPLGQAEHVDGAVDAGLGGLHRVELVVDRRGRAGEVVDLVDLDVEREGDVVAHQLEVRPVHQVGDVGAAPGEVVVDAEHLVPLPDQPVAEMAAEKSRAAGDQNTPGDPVTHAAPLSWTLTPISIAAS